MTDRDGQYRTLAGGLVRCLVEGCGWLNEKGRMVIPCTRFVLVRGVRIHWYVRECVHDYEQQFETHCSEDMSR